MLKSRPAPPPKTTLPLQVVLATERAARESDAGSALPPARATVTGGSTNSSSSSSSAGELPVADVEAVTLLRRAVARKDRAVVDGIVRVCQRVFVYLWVGFGRICDWLVALLD
jgi:hypothetical protein